ncbi:MAG TPA: hypothetical protein VMU77_05885, partial [Acidimicrobiales bacterium]|nr:hypothetical protein [Acidimicrobiales bacterium]
MSDSASPLEIVVLPYGRPAFDALCRTIARVKTSDRLSPVTVLVPNRYAQLQLRRDAAFALTYHDDRTSSDSLDVDRAGADQVGYQLGGSSPGIANARFTSAELLVDTLGGTLLAERGLMPLQGAEQAAFVGSELARQVEILGAIADHPSTEAAMLRTIGDLSVTDNKQRTWLRDMSESAATAVRLFEKVTQYAEDQKLYLPSDPAKVLFSEFAKVNAGTESSLARMLAELGYLVAYLPSLGDLVNLSLIGSLARCARAGVLSGLSIIVGMTCDELSDSLAFQMVKHFEDPGTPLDSPLPVTGSCGNSEAGADGSNAPGSGEMIVVNAPDPEEEVRAVLRRAFSHIEQGTPLYRIAILYSAEEPYRLIIHDQLKGAGIDFYGPAGGMIADSLAGRCIRGFAASLGAPLGIDSIISWLCGSPIRV